MKEFEEPSFVYCLNVLWSVQSIYVFLVRPDLLASSLTITTYLVVPVTVSLCVGASHCALAPTHCVTV